MNNTATQQEQSVKLSVSDVRNHFPALERRHNGFPVAYFDGPGGTQVPRQVVESITEYLFHHNANTHWEYPSSAETDAALAAARLAFADFFNAGPEEIVFGANMTTLTFHVARALSFGWKAGDEVVVTELDHHGNVGPWQRLARERGVTVKAVKMIPETGQLDWSHFESVVNRNTRIVAVGGASNAIGTINDVARAVKLAHEFGALAYLDVVHYAPHELVDVRALDCDFLCCSAYKFYGPHVGVLYGRRETMQKVDFPKLSPAPDTVPDVAETGTLNHEGIVGAGAAVDFLASFGTGETRREKLRSTYSQLHVRGLEIVNRLWNGLASIKGVRLYGPEPNLPRTPTVSFVVKGVASSEVSRQLAQRGLFVSHGDFYAETVIERLGLQPEGLVRAGCAIYATDEEVDRLIAAVGELS